MLFVFGATALAQVRDTTNTTTRRAQRNQPKETQPTTPSSAQRDTLSLPVNSDTTALPRTERSSPIDTAITYYARDSVSYSLKERKLRLVGDARVTYHDQQLEAAVIEIYFTTSTMVATAQRDATGRLIGVPKFTDKGESFYGERLSYNFKTKRGTITLGETTADDAFYSGKRIKRVDANTLFIEDGCFTTCDLPHPHFYFKSPNMKVIANDRVFVDPLILYVEDLPVFIYPFGLFLENKTGRRSGIIIPQFFFSDAPGTSNRGVFFQDLGYYWAVSDYFDTRFLADITTKGGFTLKNHSNVVVRDLLSSTIDLAYGQMRYSVDDEFTQSWSFGLNHNHTIDPYTRLNGNVHFTSTDYNRLTSTDLRERVQQNITSDASFQRNFDNGSSLSMSYSRNHNIITNALTEVLPSVNYSLPQLFPLRSLVDRESWASDISFSYSVAGTRTYRRPADSDTTTKADVSMRINHRPALRIAPKLGYFTISPQISYSENWYFRRLTLTPTTTGTTTRSFEDGFFREYQYDFQLSVSTKLYGIVQPRIFGLNAIRHTLSPQISFQYTPDFSTPSFGFYNTYTDPRTGNEVKYSAFSADGGGVNSQLRQSLNFSLQNNIEAKVAAASDTLPDITTQLLNFDVRGSYNFAADSLRWSEIGVGARTSAGIISLNGSASFNLYDQVHDSLSFYRTVNTLLLSAGKGLARLTRASFSLQTSLSSGGFTSLSPTQQPGLPNRDSLDYGARFRQRHDTAYAQSDIYGDSSPGYSPLDIPWNLSLFLSVSYSESSPAAIARSAALGTTFGFSLTPTWNIRSSFNYDFINKTINIPTVDISKDIHCWEFTLSWIPTGLSSGFYMRLNVKSPQISDLKIEKRDNTLYN